MDGSRASRKGARAYSLKWTPNAPAATEASPASRVGDACDRAPAFANRNSMEAAQPLGERVANAD